MGEAVSTEQLNDSPWTKLRGSNIAFDCRWLGFSGIGRATELLLEALSLSAPPGSWSLIVREVLDPSPWAGARQVVIPGDPRSPLREVFRRLPRSDVLIFPQMIRPFVLRRVVQVFHDFTPIDVAETRPGRFAKRAYLVGIATNASFILTADPSVPARLADFSPFRARPSSVIPWPIGPERAKLISERRLRDPDDGSLLFVGRLARHKNLEAFAEAFAASRWPGPLVLIGEPEPPVQIAIENIAGRTSADIRLLGRVGEAELQDAYVRARAVVLPSLFEGFGLPVQEAATAGIPVILQHRGRRDFV